MFSSLSGFIKKTGYGNVRRPIVRAVPTSIWVKSISYGGSKKNPEHETSDMLSLVTQISSTSTEKIELEEKLKHGSLSAGRKRKVEQAIRIKTTTLNTLMEILKTNAVALSETDHLNVQRISPMNPKRYYACSPVYDEAATNYLHAMKKGELRHIKHDVSVFTFDSGSTSESDIVAPNCLYFRGFYDSLLRTIRKDNKRVLIGNPGTSKSYFQFYYLARLICPQQFEDKLPPDCYHSTKPAQYVIRQIGSIHMIVYDLVNVVAEHIKGLDADIFQCFDPEKTIYMYEPDASFQEPIRGHSIPTLVTASPDTRRYKEFCKHGAAPVYMPTYTLDELLTIGEHMRENAKVPDGVSYEGAAIKKRFERYTGIIRSCLPVSASTEKAVLQNYFREIARADATKLLLHDTLEDPELCHLLAQYNVHKHGVDAFENRFIDIGSEQTRKKLRTKLTATQHVDKAAVLIKNDIVPSHMEKLCPSLYEDMITAACTSHEGLGWRRRKAYFQDRNVTAPPADIVWTEHDKISLSKLQRGELPKFKDMKLDVMYCPLDNNFPAVECLYKISETELVGIQITRQTSSTKAITVPALKALLCDKLGLQLHDAGILKLHLIHRPARSNTASLSIVAKQNAKEDEHTIRQAIIKVMPAYYVLEAPDDYRKQYLLEDTLLSSK